jgi:hypothetical protein
MKKSSLPGGLGSALSSALREDEVVEMELHMNMGEAIAVTSERVLILKAGLTVNAGFGSKAISYSYRNISSVEHRQGPLGGHVTILAAGVFESRPGGAGVFSDNANYKRENVVTYQRRELREQVQAVVHAIQGKLDERLGSPSAPDGLADQIERLAALRNSGALSDDEFIAAKQRIISGR